MSKANCTRRPGRVIPLGGKSFGRLTVIGTSPLRHDRRNRAVWLCQCSCGKQVEVASSHLRTGHTQSCGCLLADVTRSQATIHGHDRQGRRTAEYRAWHMMKVRCSNPKVKSFQDYGGRGIVVCDRWRDFANFIADMGLKPSPKHTIDRINNDGSYTCGRCPQCIAHGWPMNCRWATRTEQARNKRNTRLVTFNGKTLCVTEWERELGFRKDQLGRRLRAGWSVEAAMTIPTVHS